MMSIRRLVRLQSILIFKDLYNLTLSKLTRMAKLSEANQLSPNTTQPYVLITAMVEILNHTNMTNEYLNETAMITTMTPTSKKSMSFDRDVRIVALWLLFVLGLFGNICVFFWIWMNRRRKSRVNKIIFGLATADISVCFFTLMGSALFEMLYYQWLAGNVTCKLIMYMQTGSIMASSNMLVLIAIDRHQAVRSPLKEGLPAWRMVGAAWCVALVASVPQLYVWKLKTRGGMETCGTDFRNLPEWHRMAYLTYAAIITFFIPILIIIVAYARICKKIWDKAKDTSMGRHPTGDIYRRGGKILLQSSGSNSFIRAKSKTLKMSFVIILMFIICGLPYFIIEIMMCYRIHRINATVYGLLGIFAASNSSVNPFIFLLFNCGKYGRWADCSTTFYNGVRRWNRRHVEFDMPHVEHTSSSNSQTTKTNVDHTHQSSQNRARNGTAMHGFRNLYSIQTIQEQKF